MAMDSGELWVVKLLESGNDVANGTAHEGVARPYAGQLIDDPPVHD